MFRNAESMLTTSRMLFTKSTLCVREHPYFTGKVLQYLLQNLQIRYFLFKKKKKGAALFCAVLDTGSFLLQQVHLGVLSRGSLSFAETKRCTRIKLGNKPSLCEAGVLCWSVVFPVTPTSCRWGCFSIRFLRMSHRWSKYKFLPCLILLLHMNTHISSEKLCIMYDACQ